MDEIEDSYVLQGQGNSSYVGENNMPTYFLLNAKKFPTEELALEHESVRKWSLKLFWEKSYSPVLVRFSAEILP